MENDDLMLALYAFADNVFELREKAIAEGRYNPKGENFETAKSMLNQKLEAYIASIVERKIHEAIENEKSKLTLQMYSDGTL